MADVKRLVGKALDRSALVPDDSDVLVDTSGSTVILTGHVRTRAERDAVVGATWILPVYGRQRLPRTVVLQPRPPPIATAGAGGPGSARAQRTAPAQPRLFRPPEGTPALKVPGGSGLPRNCGYDRSRGAP